MANMGPSFLESILFMAGVNFIRVTDIPYYYWEAMAKKSTLPKNLPERLIYLEAMGVTIVGGMYLAEPVSRTDSWLEQKRVFLQNKLCLQELHETNDFFSNQKYKVLRIIDVESVKSKTIDIFVI